MDILLILVFFIFGLALGLIFKPAKKVARLIESIANSGLFILLIAMGIKIAFQEELFLKSGSIVYKAVLLALASMFGSILLVKCFCPSFSTGFVEKAKSGNVSGPAKKTFSIYIIISLFGGFILGKYFNCILTFLNLNLLIFYAEGLLLLGIGIGIGQNKDLLVQGFRYGWQIFLCPLLIALGSIGGALITSVLLKMPLNEATAVAAGFGWYSLSGIILTQLHSVEIGTLAFLSNFLRELLAIVFTPLLARYLGKTTSISLGGATTMDVTLPIVKMAAGEEIVIPAFVSGMILSILVPILIPFLIKL